MNWLFAAPTLDDLLRLLRAWRLWVLGALAGALLGAALYYLAPPPYSARATVLVDFNLEEAWPQDTDRQQFYYLERETRKLEEIAWSDDVLQAVAQTDGTATILELREKRLRLSQPGEGGWHFYASDRDPGRAALLAGAWARAFSQAALTRIGRSTGLNSFIEIEVTESTELPLERTPRLSSYLLAGTAAMLFFGAVLLLVWKPTAPSGVP